MGAAIGNCEKRPQNTKGKIPPVWRALNIFRPPFFSAKTRLKSVSLRFFASPVKFPIIILLKYTKDY